MGLSDLPKCSVLGCTAQAEFEVILYDFYPYGPDADVFFERDFTCPYICAIHAIENEREAQGERQPRGSVRYRYTNQHLAQGFTIYRSLTRIDQPGGGRTIRMSRHQ